MTIIHAFSDNQLVSVYQTTGAGLILTVLTNRYHDELMERAARIYARTSNKRSIGYIYEQLAERFADAIISFDVSRNVMFGGYVKIKLYAAERHLTYNAEFGELAV